MIRIEIKDINMKLFTLRYIGFARIMGLAFIMFASGNGLQAKNWHSTVAVVVDEITYNKVATEIEAYVESIGTDSRKGVLLVDKWQHPDSIRVALYKMYKENHLEGAVLIGDIPIPMVRDAHHLTTAFKMSPKRDWKESSVPSDRFYDDFDLKFDYIRQDEEAQLFHYYSLRADSPQMIACDIYSARIKAPAVPGKDKYELIAAFLNKAVAQKKEQKNMKRILHFAGHGYNSESMNARIDEAVALTEQFPFLSGETGDLEYIDFTFDKYIKNRLLSAVADKELDLAILHHHGSEDTQYLNGSPFTTNPKEWIELARNYFRSKVRSAKDVAKTKANYKKEFGIPDAWLDDAFDEELVKQDSIHSASMDIGISDMYGYESGAKIVILDACFNGAFNNDDYIAGYYIFNPGNTLVVKANSVNTLQDTWTTELMGLLNMGVCAGNWAKGELTLESHLLGDPTYSFVPESGITAMFKNLNLNRDMVKEKHNTAYWKQILSSKQAHKVPADLKALAIKMLYNNKAITSGELLKIQENDPSRIVRLEAFMTNKQIADENLPQAIALAMTDSYELTRRLGALTSAKNVSPSLLPVVCTMYMNPAITAREKFQIQYSMDGFNADSLVMYLANMRKSSPSWPEEAVYDTKIQSISRNAKVRKNEFDALKEDKTSLRDKQFTVSAQRNNCNPAALDGLFYVIKESDNDELRLQATEALGWYRYSYKKPEILAKCSVLYEAEKNEAVKKELLKTMNRLK